MGRAELFRQTEDHVPDSVLLDWVEEYLEEFYYISVGGNPECRIISNIFTDNYPTMFKGKNLRQAIKNGIGVG